MLIVLDDRAWLLRGDKCFYNTQIVSQGTNIYFNRVVLRTRFDHNDNLRSFLINEFVEMQGLQST